MPPKCEKCRSIVEINGSLCEKCWGSLIFIDEPLCQKCGYPFSFSISPDALKICTNCINNENNFDMARSVCKYEGLAKDMVIALKFNDDTKKVLFISNIIGSKFQSILRKPNTIIIPVPMDKKSLVKRMFNQTALIAKRISKKYNIPYHPFLIQKIRSTSKQITLDREKRAKNLKNSFRLNSKKISKIKDIQNIIIIDDVFTTGATFNEITRTIKKSLPDIQVICLSFARTIL